MLKVSNIMGKKISQLGINDPHLLPLGMLVEVTMGDTDAVASFSTLTYITVWCVTLYYTQGRHANQYD